VRTDNVDRVRDALGSSTKTLRQLSITGLSRNTVIAALKLIGAEPVPDSYPKQFRMPVARTGRTTPVPVNMPTITRAKKRVQVELIDHENMANRWNMGRLTFAQTVGDLVIDPHADPKDLADSFARAARTLASAAYAVQEAAQHPDWYTLLGGSLDEAVE
jgi:hypothetical protein